ncbi:MAG: hypothetical protein MGG37_17055 [Trichodesmium sp. MAG_R01]|nr:hypothetical protein [Trichodesmium sp. MAG_R01]
MEEKLNIYVYIQNVYITDQNTTSEEKDFSDGLVAQDSSGVEDKGVTNKKFGLFDIVTHIVKTVLSTVIAKKLLSLF